MLTRYGLCNDYKILKKMITIKDKKELIKLCSFMTMGDGGVYKKGKNCCFVMNMIKKNEDYILKCKEILENITTCKITEVQKEGNRQLQLRLTTMSHPFWRNGNE